MLPRWGVYCFEGIGPSLLGWAKVYWPVGPEFMGRHFVSQSIRLGYDILVRWAEMHGGTLVPVRWGKISGLREGMFYIGG